MSFNWDSVLKSLGDGVKKSYESGLESYYSNASYKSKGIYNSYIRYIKPASDMLKSRKSDVSSIIFSEEYKNAKDDKLKMKVYSLLEYSKNDKDIMEILDQELRICKKNIQTEMDHKLFETMNNMCEVMKETYDNFSQLRQNLASSCQKCGFTNPDHKNFCTKCGSKIIFLDLQKYQEMRRKQQEREDRRKAAEERKQKEIRMRKFICTSCGQKNEPGAAFCAECGGLTFYGKMIDLKKRFSNGDGEAAYELAHIYCDGEIVDKDEERGIKYFEAAIELGSVAAMYEWGKNNICEDDKEIVSKAISYIKKAAQAGYPPAETYLGNMFLLGDEVEHDEQLGLKYLFRAEKHGDSGAKYYIAEMYLHGYLLESDTKKGLELLDEAVEMGNDDAMHSRGNLYLNGVIGEINEKKGLQLIEKSANNNNLFALYDLGFFYLQGKYVTKNLKKAVDCFEKAAQGGNVDAYFELGKLYIEGDDVKQNVKKGLLYLHKAADYIDDAKIYLAYVYISDMYVENDYDEALNIVSDLVDQENPEALFLAASAHMGKVTSDLENIDSEEFDLSIELLKKAANLGHSKALEAIKRINPDNN